MSSAPALKAAELTSLMPVAWLDAIDGMVPTDAWEALAAKLGASDVAECLPVSRLLVPSPRGDTTRERFAP